MAESNRMLAATYTQGGTFSIEDVPVPEIESDEILLRVRAAAICGTDTRIAHSGHSKLVEGQRIVLGHEFVGIIERLGARVAQYKVGQRVGVAPNAGCGHCHACTSGRSNYCPAYTAFGIDRDGGQAPYVRIPGRFVTQGNVIALPEEVSDMDAALLEPLSCVVNCIRVSQIELGDTVVIYGVGPMGLIHVMLCRIAGAARIIVVDPLAHRLEKSRQLGSDMTLNPSEDDVVARIQHATGGRGANVVIAACPIPSVQAEALRVLAPFGRLSLFGGLPKKTGPVGLDTNLVHYGNLLITGSTGGSVEDYSIALKLVSGQRVKLSRIVSDVFQLDNLRQGYDKALSGAEGKVVLVAE